jgi:hypothetical protein
MSEQLPLPSLVGKELERDILMGQIFMPYAMERRYKFYGSTPSSEPTARFVHYTSAEAALGIIKTKRVWMRNTTCMADYSEVQHGFEILKRFFADSRRLQYFTTALNSVSAGIADEALKQFNEWWRDIRFGTYIASVSEHDDSEDANGRLSMWRAFGGSSARVAIVFRVPWNLQGARDLNLLFSPVAYLNEAQAHSYLERVICNVTNNRGFLQSVDEQIVVNTVFNALVAGVTCLKHEGFREEREWRVIYGPKRQPSKLVLPSTQVVGGTPQIVYELPLDSRASPSLADLDLARIFDRLIIGPSQFSWAMVEAFAAELQGIGVSDAVSRLAISGIPIRS